MLKEAKKRRVEISEKEDQRLHNDLSSSIERFKEIIQPSISTDNSSEFTMLPNVNQIFLNNVTPTLVPVHDDNDGTLIDDSIVDMVSPKKNLTTVCPAEESIIENKALSTDNKKLIKETKIIELEGAEIYFEKENVSPSNCHFKKFESTPIVENVLPIEKKQKKHTKIETLSLKKSKKIKPSENILNNNQMVKVEVKGKTESLSLGKPKFFDECSSSDYNDYNSISPDHESLDQSCLPTTPSSADYCERIVSLWTNYISPNRDHSLFSNPSFSKAKTSNIQKKNLVDSLPNETTFLKPIVEEFSLSKKKLPESSTVRKSQSTEIPDEKPPPRDEKESRIHNKVKSQTGNSCSEDCVIPPTPPNKKQIYSNCRTSLNRSKEKEPEKDQGIATEAAELEELENEWNKVTFENEIASNKTNCEAKKVATLNKKHTDEKNKFQLDHLKEEVNNDNSDTDVAFNIDYCKIHDNDEVVKHHHETNHRINDNKEDLIFIGSSIGDTDLVFQSGKKKHKHRKSCEDLIDIGSSLGGTDFEATCPTITSKKPSKEEEILFGSSIGNDLDKILEAEKKIQSQIKKDVCSNKIQEVSSQATAHKSPSPKSPSSKSKSPSSKSLSPKSPPSPPSHLLPASPPPPPLFISKEQKLNSNQKLPKKMSLDYQKQKDKKSRQSDCAVAKHSSQEIELSDESDEDQYQATTKENMSDFNSTLNKSKRKFLDHQKEREKKNKAFKSRQSNCAVTKPPSQEIELSDVSDEDQYPATTKGRNADLNSTLNKSKKKRRISSSDETDNEEPVSKLKEKLGESLISYTPPKFQKHDESSDEDKDTLPQLPFKKKEKEGIKTCLFNSLSTSYFW